MNWIDISLVEFDYFFMHTHTHSYFGWEMLLHVTVCVFLFDLECIDFHTIHTYVYTNRCIFQMHCSAQHCSPLPKSSHLYAKWRYVCVRVRPILSDALRTKQPENRLATSYRILLVTIRWLSFHCFVVIVIYKFSAHKSNESSVETERNRCMLLSERRHCGNARHKFRKFGLVCWSISRMQSTTSTLLPFILPFVMICSELLYEHIFVLKIFCLNYLCLTKYNWSKIFNSLHFSLLSLQFNQDLYSTSGVPLTSSSASVSSHSPCSPILPQSVALNATQTGGSTTIPTIPLGSLHRSIAKEEDLSSVTRQSDNDGMYPFNSIQFFSLTFKCHTVASLSPWCTWKRQARLFFTRPLFQPAWICMVFSWFLSPRFFLAGLLLLFICIDRSIISGMN